MLIAFGMLMLPLLFAACWVSAQEGEEEEEEEEEGEGEEGGG